MPYLLNLAYLLLLLLASPWLLYRAVRQGKYRQGIPAKLLGQVPFIVERWGKAQSRHCGDISNVP